MPASEDQTSPSVPYWLLHVGVDGVSTQRQCAFTQFESKGIQPGADPQWVGKTVRQMSGVMTTVLPVGWVGDWHENPAPQWIVPLSGRWFVEAMDGTRREFGSGEMSFGADQGCRGPKDRIGHRSGTVGDRPCTLMLVQFDDWTPGADPSSCPFA